MENFTINEIINTDFKVSAQSPVIRPFHGSFVAADPSLLTPDKTPDGRWHIFFHTTFGVWHFLSPDGINFEKAQKICPDAMRADINYINGKYVLYYEHTRRLIFNALNVAGLAKWKSGIYMTQSDDLLHWSEPEAVIGNTREFEKSGKGYSISNPFYLDVNGKSRLYYSCGLTFIKDCGFSEPTYINYAESDAYNGKFTASGKPIIEPDKNDPYLNLCSGCLKVYKLKDGFIGIQNGIYESGGKSQSAIILLKSDDGLKFEFVKPLLEPDPSIPWMAQYVYASHLVNYNGELRLYFNARDKSAMLTGRECIGYAVNR